MKTLLKLMAKLAIVAVAGVLTAVALAGPDEIMTDIDRETFPGLTALATIGIWWVMLRLLFGGRKKRRAAELAAVPGEGTEEIV